jgi:hypothetical protein
MTSSRWQAGRGQAGNGSRTLKQAVVALADCATSAAADHDSDRRAHRRHDLEQQGLTVERWDGAKRGGGNALLGQIVDISAGGVRIRTRQTNVRADNQIRVRLELPAYAGIFPFIDTTGQDPQPKHEWVGWMAVCRVIPVGNDEVELAGRLLDMEEMDRGMLGLYLSTQPLAA